MAARSAKRTVVVMPGDGIGAVVVPEAVRVLEAAGFDATFVTAEIGWSCWLRDGDALPQRTIELARGAQARPAGRDHVEAARRRRKPSSRLVSRAAD